VAPPQSQLRQRLISAAIFIPILLVIIWLGDPWFSILVALAVLLGAFEFYRLVTQASYQPFLFFGLFFTLLFVLNAHSPEPRTTPLLVAATIICSLFWLIFHHDEEKAFINGLWTLAGIFYLGWMLSHFIPLRGVENGLGWVIFALFTTFAADSSAFFVGRAWGKHYMVPRISPGKTWEGTIGGFVGGALAALALAAILNSLNIGLPISYGKVAFLGFLIAIFALLGDLVESMLKRRAGVKESGILIPGHGGILDRLDSVIFTVVLVYYYVIWFIG
jgi:phosphatidate cytidylyltransferase